MPPRLTPTLADVVGASIDARLSDVNVAIPARVESYDSGSRRVSAQPLIKRAYADESGERQVERLPVVTEVPVIFPGSGGARVIFPIGIGDVVLLVFSQTSLDKWLTRGDEVDPEDDRRHALTDAVAIPGLMHTGGDAGQVLEFDGAFAHLGGSLGSEPTVKGTTYLTAEGVMIAAVAAAFTSLALPASGLPPAQLTACTAAATAIATFLAGTATYPTLVAKVQ